MMSPLQHQVHLDQLRTQPLRRGRSDSIFIARPRLEGARPVKVLLNGKDTGVRMPVDWTIQIIGHDRAGHIYGNLSENFSGAYSGINFIGFTTQKGKLHIIRPPAGYMDTQITAVTADGDFAGVWNFTSTFGSLDHRYDNVSHGFYTSHGRTIDLGPAERLSFAGPGILLGDALRERGTHRYLGLEVGGESEVEHFRWSKGKRTIVSVSLPK